MVVEYELQGELSQILWKDNVHQLLVLLNYLYRRGGNAVPFEQALGEALASSCRTGAVKCVAALINGKSPLVVDIHSPCDKLFYPLHYAADSGHPGVTELLLYHGARTDVRCNCSDIRITHGDPHDDHPCNLPLHIALNKIRCSVPIGDFKVHPISSLVHFIIRLSLPSMRNLLETVRLLASRTEEIKEEFLHFARNGRVAECAILLVVARKKRLYSGFYCPEGVMLQLIHLFQRAGDEIDAYFEKYKLEEKLQVIPEANIWLQKAGIYGYYQKRNYLGSMVIYRMAPRDEENLYTQQVTDIGMPHYSTSGSRWDLSKNPEPEPEPEPEPGCYKFKVPADKVADPYNPQCADLIEMESLQGLGNCKIPFWFPSFHHPKLSADPYHYDLESASVAKLKRFESASVAKLKRFALNSSNLLDESKSVAKLKRFALNSLNIISSKPWVLFPGVIKRFFMR